MRANPEPHDSIPFKNTECSPVEVHPGRVDGFSVVNLLESDGRMVRIVNPELVGSLDLRLAQERADGLSGDAVVALRDTGQS